MTDRSDFWWDDPVEEHVGGDPDQVWVMAGVLKDKADTMDALALKLRSVNAAIWQGEAATKFAEIIAETPAEFYVLARRFGSVSEALAAYVKPLRAAQVKMTWAKAKGEAAHYQLKWALAALQEAEAANAAELQRVEGYDPSEPGGQPNLTDMAPLQRDWDEADDLEAEAARLFQEAKDEFEACAQACASEIRSCLDDLMLDDWRDNTKQFFKDAPEVLGHITVGLVAIGLVALALGASGFAALIGSALTIIGWITLALDFSNWVILDQGDALTVAFGLVGVGAVGALSRALKGASAARQLKNAQGVLTEVTEAASGRPLVLAGQKMGYTNLSQGVRPQAIARAEAAVYKAGEQVRGLQPWDEVVNMGRPTQETLAVVNGVVTVGRPQQMANWTKQNTLNLVTSPYPREEVIDKGIEAALPPAPPVGLDRITERGRRKPEEAPKHQ